MDCLSFFEFFRICHLKFILTTQRLLVLIMSKIRWRLINLSLQTYEVIKAQARKTK